jgi:hypothetical protein
MLDVCKVRISNFIINYTVKQLVLTDMLHFSGACIVFKSFLKTYAAASSKTLINLSLYLPSYCRKFKMHDHELFACLFC